MKHYEQLLLMGCFTWEELCEAIGSETTAHTLVYRYMKQGYIARVRRGLYVALDLLTKSSSVNKYRIASQISPTSYISHYSAFEYFGLQNQVSYIVNVSSETPFADFNYEGITYSHISSRLSQGITHQTDGVRITDIERTVLDGINDFDKVMGLEELLRCLSLVPSLDEQRLLDYLSAYKKQVLYQKTGYLLEHLKTELRLSDRFFEICSANIGKSKRYLLRNDTFVDVSYNEKWRLITPKNLMAIIEGGYQDAPI
jgi:predicted transcriptional regulator of viral defense system